MIAWRIVRIRLGEEVVVAARGRLSRVVQEGIGWTKTLGDCVKNGQAQYCSYQTVRPLQRNRRDARRGEQRSKELGELWGKAYAEPKKYPQVKVRECVSARGCADIMKAVDAGGEARTAVVGEDVVDAARDDTTRRARPLDGGGR